MSKVEIRAVGELTFSMDGDRPRIEARAIKYDSWSVDLGGFRERILPNAVELDSDLVALFDHATDKVLGRVSAGTMTVRSDSAGIAFTAFPPETTWAKDLQVSMERGDIKGCSFRMFVDEDRWYVENGEVRRDVSKARVSELTVTSMPAYPETSAEARSTAQALAEKSEENRAGRVLSSSNEIALKAALEAVSLAETTLEAVLSQINPSSDVESEDEADEIEEELSSVEHRRADCGCSECACAPKDSETLDGSSSQPRLSVGATETTPTRSSFYSSKFGLLITRKEN
jgi:HK97 family phage prohead protease